MKKLVSILMVLALLAFWTAAAAETTATVPTFMIPSKFVARYNLLIGVLGDEYAEELGEEGVQILNEDYTITQVDSQGSIVYYGTKNWEIEADYFYADGTKTGEMTPAANMTFAIRRDAPQVAASIAEYAFEMVVFYEYQNEVSLDDMDSWFGTVKGPETPFALPGYSLTAFFLEDYTQFAILPSDMTGQPEITSETTPEITEKPEAEPTPASSMKNITAWVDFHCDEEGFTTRKPEDSNYEFKNDKGYAGIRFYLSIPGAPPYVMVNRRSEEGKFRNPEGYLNNTYREFLEDKYAEYGTSVAFSPAKTWEIDDKKLIGAKYDIGGTIQLQLIEVRELGDVEYTAMFDPADEDVAMEALEAAVIFYIEDDASSAAKALVQAKAAVADLRSYTAKDDQQPKDDQQTQNDPQTKDDQQTEDKPHTSAMKNAPKRSEDPFYNQTWETWEAEQKATARHQVELFLTYFSGDLTELDSKVKSILGGGTDRTGDSGQTGTNDVTVDTSWMTEEWMDDEWKKEFIAAWAEERAAAKEFTAGFTSKLTEEDLLTFILTFDNDYRYILGKTTPKDLMDNGWSVGMEGGGVLSLRNKDGDETGIYLSTEHGYLDEPILTMNAFWEEGLTAAYCGFDGMVGIHAEDPDEYWFPDETGMKLGQLLSDGERLDLWDGLVNWLVTDLGAVQNEEGIYETKIPLSDGRTLYVSSHDSQVRISLVGFD